MRITPITPTQRLRKWFVAPKNHETLLIGDDEQRSFEDPQKAWEAKQELETDILV